MTSGSHSGVYLLGHLGYSAVKPTTSCLHGLLTNLKEARCSLETLADFQWDIRRYIPQDIMKNVCTYINNSTNLNAPLIFDGGTP